MRPDAVDKSFTGTLADRTSFVPTLMGAGLDPTRLVLLATPREIAYEWRLLVANGRIIAGSQYAAGGAAQVVAGCPDEVVAFAATILEQVDWRPDPLFVVDICSAEEGLRLLELNSFSCSAHHLADLRTVIEAASAVAALAW